MAEQNKEELAQKIQQLEARFCHTDRDHPAIRVLFELQVNTLQAPKLE